MSLASELKTNAPASSGAATAVIFWETASNEGWAMGQGDVDSAFLNDRYLDDKRRASPKAPKGGLQATPTLRCPRVPAGTT